MVTIWSQVARWAQIQICLVRISLAASFFSGYLHISLPFQPYRYIAVKRSPQLNGKVGRSHRTDNEEFYQLLTYTDDVDLNKKLAEWERFYNLDRPHGAFKGKTPYEALRCKLV